MRQNSNSKELVRTEAVKIVTNGSPALRRSVRNCSPNLPRRSERLTKNTAEGSSSRRKSERSGTLALNSGDELGKGLSMINVKRRKVSVETSGSQENDKRRLDVRGYRTLFVKQHKKRAEPALVPIEEPKLLEKPRKKACCGIDSAEAKEKHQSINNQSENKLLNISEDSIEDPDICKRIAAEVQSRGVITSGSIEHSERNGDCEVPVIKCEASPAKLDSSKIMSSEEFECVSSSQHKESPSERDGGIHASVPEDTPLVSSRDNKGSASDVESFRVEADSESRLKLVQADAASRNSSLHVDANVEDDVENIHVRETNDLTQCDVVMDSAQALYPESAPASRNANEADNLSAKSASSPRKNRFLEYWVPACLSNLQLEQYCSALLSKSILLRSSSRSDPVGALRSLLVTLRQTCSHPFLVDQSLSSSLLKDVKETEYLDVGIKASGKLQLLDSMLLEMRKLGLRVLILYESIDGRDGIGDILDDFLRQRYGQDSYERVDGGGFIPSKKQAAVNKFNDKESGRFAFLLETRACLPSIKLSSVDAVIIHNSEWNPVNDIRALQKIVIDSQHDPINVFRLFLPQTVEENAMLLAKHNVTIDNRMHNINQSNREKLLMNGAQDLFDELEKFHRVSAPVSTVISSMESSLLQDVVQELMTIILQNGRKMVDGQSICLKLQRNEGDHGKYCLMSDEVKMPLEEKWPPEFWSELLEGRNPQWRYVSTSDQRNRKRVRYDVSEDSLSFRSDDVVKRRRKVVHDNIDTTSTIGNERVVTSDKDPGCDEHLSESLHLSRKSIAADDVRSSPEVHSINAVKSGNMLEKSKQVNDTQKALFLNLKPELAKLCEVLNMPEDVKDVAEWFLQYAMDYQDISREPVTRLQAFQLSVCWVAASLRKFNINCQESLALAKQHLKFCCDEDDTDYIYLKLGLFKELFIHHIVNDQANDLAYDKSSRVFDPEKVMVKIIKQIKKKCRQRSEFLIQKQLKELEQLKKSIDAELAQLDQQYKLETTLVHFIHSQNSSVAASKIKIIQDQFTMKLEEHRNSENIRLKNLEDKHLSERDRESALTSGWKEDIVKEQLEILRKFRLINSENSEQKCISNDEPLVRDGCLLENQGVPEGPPALPAAAAATPEADKNFVGVDSEVSTLGELLMERSTSFFPGGFKVPCFQASNSVNQTPDIEVPKSSSVDACPVTSQQLSPSTDLISCSGLLNTPTIDGSESRSRDDPIGSQHESEAPSKEPIVPFPLAPDNEVDSSSPIQCPLKEADNSLHPRQKDVEVPVTKEGQAELPSFIVMPINEQMATGNDVGASTAELLHHLPHTSSSKPNSGTPMLQVQPSLGIESIQNTDAQNLIVDNNIEHPNSSQLPTNVGITCIQPATVASAPASLHVPRNTHATPNFANSDATSSLTVSSRAPYMYQDPLQGELERIQKLADHSIKIYEEQKQHLNSECEKEIEEMVAQIRKEFEAKSLELDVAFTCRKTELDIYHKKVFMNKKLAEAFRNKCMDLKASASSGTAQDNMQQRMLRPLLVSRHQMIPGVSSAMQTSRNSQHTHSPMRPRNLQAIHNPVRPSGHTGATTQMPTNSANPTGLSRFSAVQTTAAVAPLPRHVVSSSSGLPSTRQYHTLPLRNPVDTSSPLEAVISLPVQTRNSSAALFSSKSYRPIVSTPPRVNLHSTSGVSVQTLHLLARVPQPPASNPTFSSPPINSSQTQNSNVSLTAPSSTNPNGHLSANQPNRSAPATSNVVCLSDDD